MVHGEAVQRGDGHRVDDHLVVPGIRGEEARRGLGRHDALQRQLGCVRGGALAGEQRRVAALGHPDRDPRPSGADRRDLPDGTDQVDHAVALGLAREQRVPLPVGAQAVVVARDGHAPHAPERAGRAAAARRALRGHALGAVAVGHDRPAAGRRLSGRVADRPGDGDVAVLRVAGVVHDPRRGQPRPRRGHRLGPDQLAGLAERERVRGVVEVTGRRGRARRGQSDRDEQRRHDRRHAPPGRPSSPASCCRHVPSPLRAAPLRHRIRGAVNGRERRSVRARTGRCAIDHTWGS